MSRGKYDNIDINGLMREAEHSISYSAKRAIEMYYIDVYILEPAIYLFDKAAEAYALREWETTHCKELMLKFGMMDYPKKVV